MVLSLGTVASAEVYEDWDKVTINKNLTVNGVNPTETFNFTVDDGTYSGLATPAIPSIPDFSITVTEPATTGSVNIDLPVFPELGVYSYNISETAGNTAGFGYDSAPKELIVTVINNPAYVAGGSEPKFLRIVTMTDVEKEIKVDSFENSFNSSDLEISKTVSGNSGELDRYFEFKVTLTAPEGKTVNLEKVSITPTSYADNPDSVPVFSGGVSEFSIFLKHGESVSIKNLPRVIYTVEEIINDEDGYTVGGEVKDSVIGATNKVGITNLRDTEIPTGVNLDNLPYILLMAFAAGGLVIFAMRRRVTDR